MRGRAQRLWTEAGRGPPALRSLLLHTAPPTAHDDASIGPNRGDPTTTSPSRRLHAPFDLRPLALGGYRGNRQRASDPPPVSCGAQAVSLTVEAVGRDLSPHASSGGQQDQLAPTAAAPFWPAPARRALSRSRRPSLSRRSRSWRSVKRGRTPRLCRNTCGRQHGAHASTGRSRERGHPRRRARRPAHERGTSRQTRRCMRTFAGAVTATPPARALERGGACPTSWSSSQSQPQSRSARSRPSRCPARPAKPGGRSRQPSASSGASARAPRPLTRRPLHCDSRAKANTERGAPLRKRLASIHPIPQGTRILRANSHLPPRTDCVRLRCSYVVRYAPTGIPAPSGQSVQIVAGSPSHTGLLPKATEGGKAADR